MKKWQLIIIIIVLALLSSIGGYQLQQNIQADKLEPAIVVKNPIAPKEVIGTKFEDFSLSDVDGVQRHLSEWQGKVMVINFWATWCSPCREEIPAFIELQQQYASDGLQFIGIALQQAEEVREFIDEFNVNYPSLVGDDDVIKAAKKLGNDIGALPYTVIIDRNGVISFTRRGPLSKSEAELAIKALL
ncbi:MAG TPA: TlpA family protein disulfide reductase [Thiotrichaceae bacterium]|jgi:thiol-disulfide isomerase/thioredoxin|nr:TlpA family protein disulfide reductase [Thiotrichaceae bacterium]HIM08565.1 TlpA family protein disulfide reductase [Gammaproteobacteria bacterium]